MRKKSQQKEPAMAVAETVKVTDPELSALVAQMMLAERPPLDPRITRAELDYLERSKWIWFAVRDVERRGATRGLAAGLSLAFVASVLVGVISARFTTGSAAVDVWGLLGAGAATLALWGGAFMVARYGWKLWVGMKASTMGHLAEFLVICLYSERTGRPVDLAWRTQLRPTQVRSGGAALIFPPTEPDEGTGM